MFKQLLVVLCALSVTVLATNASVAVAQEDEVFVDPESPSGKEYALPIDRARRQAASGRKRTAKRTAPLFGEGVDSSAGSGETPTAATSKDRSRTASREARRKSRPDAKPAAAADEARDEAQLARVPSLPAQAATPDGGVGIGVIIAAGLGVLVVGGLVGLWLRRRAVPPS